MNNKKNILRIAAVGVLSALALVVAGCVEAPAPIFTCANGAAQTGAAPGNTNFEQCVSCESGFRLEGARGGDVLDGARCIATAYTCINGTPATGSPAGNSDAPQCARCTEGFLLTESNSCSNDLDNDGVFNARDVDNDGDGLIEIRTLDELNNMRFNLAGTGYRSTSGGANSTTGCGNGGTVNACSGYELVRSLDFADVASYADSTVNSDWRPNNANPDNATNSGWVPIGIDSSRFTATFEGNGNTISNLYARGGDNQDGIGLFGYTQGATLRKVGIVDYRLYSGGGQDFIGGLVGQITTTIIIASYATGTANGGGESDRVGGLVGNQIGGSITASYAIVNVSGDVDSFDSVGGLVGLVTSNSNHATASITASYAAGTLNGGDGNTDSVGGLVGVGNNGGTSVTITASYATGSADGGAGATDRVGRLTGNTVGGVSTITASYGFATTENGTANTLGTHPNSAVNSAVVLSEAGSSAPTASTTNAGPQWTNSETNPTWQWDFGTNTQNPALVVDFNGDGTATWQEFGSQPRQ